MLLTYFYFCYRISTDGQDFFTSYDEVYDSFDAMGLQENLLRGIYAYGTSFYSSCGR
ncbi:putative RNA helicase [Helianthus annuus]|nr:putative RNA helicase [Helianthus annuus]